MSAPQANDSSIIHGAAANVVPQSQAGTMAGQSAPTTGTAEDLQTNEGSFMQQVKGYAKEFSGKTFGKEHEVQQGQAVRRGELSTDEAKSEITKDTVGNASA